MGSGIRDAERHEHGIQPKYPAAGEGVSGEGNGDGGGGENGGCEGGGGEGGKGSGGEGGAGKRASGSHVGALGFISDRDGGGTSILGVERRWRERFERALAPSASDHCYNT